MKTQPRRHRQPLWCALLLLLLALSFLAGCTRRSTQKDEAPELSVSLAVSPSPVLVGEASVVVTLVDATGAPVQGADLRLHGDMTHAGMAPVDLSLREQAPGLYSASVELSMAGDWVLSARGTLADGRRLVREFSLSVSPPPP
jgi:hypothetical protein